MTLKIKSIEGNLEELLSKWSGNARDRSAVEQSIQQAGRSSEVSNPLKIMLEPIINNQPAVIETLEELFQLLLKMTRLRMNITTLQNHPILSQVSNMVISSTQYASLQQDEQNFTRQIMNILHAVYDNYQRSNNKDLICRAIYTVLTNGDNNTNNISQFVQYANEYFQKIQNPSATNGDDLCKSLINMQSLLANARLQDYITQATSNSREIINNMHSFFNIAIANYQKKQEQASVGKTINIYSQTRLWKVLQEISAGLRPYPIFNLAIGASQEEIMNFNTLSPDKQVEIFLKVRNSMIWYRSILVTSAGLLLGGGVGALCAGALYPLISRTIGELVEIPTYANIPHTQTKISQARGQVLFNLGLFVTLAALTPSIPILPLVAGAIGTIADRGRTLRVGFYNLFRSVFESFTNPNSFLAKVFSNISKGPSALTNPLELFSTCLLYTSPSPRDS